MEDNKNKKVPNVPTLRFPEFAKNDDWLSLKIYEVCKITTGTFDANAMSNSGKFPFFTCAKQVYRIDKYTFDAEALLVSGNGANVGYIHYCNGKFSAYQRTYVLWDFNINIFFVKYFLEGFLKARIFKERRDGNTPYIVLDTLRKFKFYAPKLEEQTKIAIFLSLIDKRIELQNKIIKDYKLLKKELNNKLFCQINNSTPKIRFKNFYEKWAKNKVKNIFESVTRGYALSKKDISTIKTNTFKYPVYSSQTLNNGLLGYYSNYLYENAITWTTDGANAGEVNFRKDKFYCTNVCGVLLSNNGYCNECMAAIINKVTKKFVSLVGNPKLMNNVMENIEIIFPSNIKEQLKISIFLSTIDKIIALYKNAINLYKKQKNFFLSKLFI